MPLSPEERERLRKRIRSDLEAAHQEGKSASDVHVSGVIRPDETRLQQIQHIRDQVEEEFYAEHPEYIQYVDRYGIRKWLLEDELRLKRQKGRARRNAKRQKQISSIRNALLTVIVVLAAYVGFRVYQRVNVPPTVKIVSNVESGMVFVNNQISPLKPNGVGHLPAGEYAIGIAAPGFRTRFQKVTIDRKKDTTFVKFELERDPNFDPDLTGLWRQKIPPPRPDEPVFITELRKLSDRTKRQATDLSATQSYQSRTGTTGTGGVFITSNVPDATVYLNGSPTPLPQNTLLSNLPTGELTFELRKPGYSTKPAFLTTKRENPDEKISLAFELIAEKTVSVKIRTEPVVGEIRFDGVSVGRGTVMQEPGYGMHTVSFGEVAGFHTPENQMVEITERSSQVDVVGTYLPSVDIELKLDELGRIKSRGVINIETGYWVEEKGAVPSTEYGPEVIKVKPFDFFVYQFGPGRPNANPSGNDYIDFTFNLATGFNAGRSLSLVLEGYATNRNFQFNLTKMTEITIAVNGQTVQTGIRPTVNIDENRSVARDAYPIGRFLKTGANHVTIRTTDNSKCFYLLRGLRIE